MRKLLPVSFRFTPEFLWQIDSYAARKTRETGIKWSRIAAVKFLVRSALEHEDVDERAVAAVQEGLTGQHRERRARAIQKARQR
mgnify:CR=1 FL=1